MWSFFERLGRGASRLYKKARLKFSPPSSKRRRPREAMVVGGAITLGLATTLSVFFIGPALREIPWAKVGWVMLGIALVVALTWLAVKARRSSNPKFKKYASTATKAIAALIAVWALLFWLGPMGVTKIKSWGGPSTTTHAPSPQRVLGDTALHVLLKGDSIEVLIPGQGTLDAWFDPDKVASRQIWRRARKARVYTLKAGVDSAHVFVCGYQVPVGQVDCGRS